MASNFQEYPSVNMANDESRVVDRHDTGDSAVYEREAVNLPKSFREADLQKHKFLTYRP